MTEDELVQIEQRAGAATAGPWHLAMHCDEHGEDATRANVEAGAVDVANGVLNDDAAFIAHARGDVPALVAEVRRLRGLVQSAEWKNCDGNVSGCSSACPWCEAEYVRADGAVGAHEPTCPAFPSVEAV